MSNVRCWNCGNDFEHVSSPQNTNKNISPQYIEQVLLDNIFDGDRGGIVEARVDFLVQEIAEVIAESI